MLDLLAIKHQPQQPIPGQMDHPLLEQVILNRLRYLLQQRIPAQQPLIVVQ